MMKSRRAQLTMAASAGALLMGFSTTALAQATPGVSLDEIVVTARKVEENLQDVPVAVTAFDSEALRRRNAVRIEDIAPLTPGLVIREGSMSSGSAVFTLRGLAQPEILATVDPSVGAYVDGLYWARAHGLNANLLDVQNVQVLKGPQGTLFGRNTTGGAILIDTKDPSTAGVSGMFAATYGRFNEIILTGVGNIPLIEDKLAARIAVERITRDGYVKDAVFNRRYGDRDSWQVRAKLLFMPTDNITLRFSAELYDSDTHAGEKYSAYLVPNGLTPPPPTAEYIAAATAAGFPAAYPPIGSSGASSIGGIAVYRAAIAALGKNGVSNDYAPVSYVETSTYNSTSTVDTGLGVFKLVLGYRRVNDKTDTDVDGSQFFIHSAYQPRKIIQKSAELQLTGTTLDDRLDYATGAFLFKEDGFDQSFVITLPNLNPQTNIFDGVIDNKSLGAYAQVTYRVTDALSLTGGLRYSEDSKGLISRNIFINRTNNVVTCQIPTLTTANGCYIRRDNTFDGVSYTFGADYRFNEDTMAYLKTSKGYRSGGQNLRANAVVAALPFEPEVVKSHEIGLKSESFDRRLRVNLAGYYTEDIDIQRTTIRALATGSTSTIISNAGKIRIIGGELEATAQLTEEFRLNATAAVAKPKYLDFSEVPSRVNPTGDRTSERIVSVPETTFSISGIYTKELSVGLLTLNADYSWSDDYALTPDVAFLGDPLGVTIDPATGRTVMAELIDRSTYKASGLINARASLQLSDGRYEFAVFGRNLGNNRQPVNAVYVGGIGELITIPQAPATYGVSVTMKFGQ